MGVIYSLGIPSPWRPGGSWCWETLGLPHYVRFFDADQEVQRTFQNQVPQEPQGAILPEMQLPPASIWAAAPEELSDAKKAFPPAAFN